VPIYRGGFEILFTRNSDNNVIYRRKALKADGSGDTAASSPDERKVTIKTFYLRVPIIEYSRGAELKLIKELVNNCCLSIQRMGVHSTNRRTRKKICNSM
jgi:hypothetical protein